MDDHMEIDIDVEDSDDDHLIDLGSYEFARRRVLDFGFEGDSDDNAHALSLIRSPRFHLQRVDSVLDLANYSLVNNDVEPEDPGDHEDSDDDDDDGSRVNEVLRNDDNSHVNEVPRNDDDSHVNEVPGNDDDNSRVNEEPRNDDDTSHATPNESSTNEEQPRKALLDGDILKTKDIDKIKSPKPDVSSEDEGLICIICFEPWTNSGAHRLVSLRCGHLFGKSCIAKWVRSRDAKCPQCNARARKAEVRPIFARTIKALDTSERDWAIKKLEKESMKRKAAELEAAQMRLKNEILQQKITQLQSSLSTANMQLSAARAKIKPCDVSSQSAKCQSIFSAFKSLDLRVSGCRVMDCSSMLGMLAVSQPSTNPLFPGFGLKKISVPDATLSEFILLHQKPIKDLSFHSKDALILTASIDKTVKLTNLLTNSVVQTCNLGCDVWSCTWDYDDQNYFYAGTKTGNVFVYDIRMSNNIVSDLRGATDFSPVVSLQYLTHQPNASSSKCGPVSGQLGSCCFFEKMPNVTYYLHPLPLEGKFTSFSCESTTGHLLASCRPSTKQPHVTHTLYELSTEKNDVQCHFVQTMMGGNSQMQLTRSKLMLDPSNDSTVLACAGDEETKSILVWNGCSGVQLDKLVVDSPVLDVTTFRWDTPVLAALTDKKLHFYTWKNN